MKKDIWDFLFWLMLAIALGFVILKIAGIIKTPDWVNYIPIMTIIFAAGIAYQKLFSFMNTMNSRTLYLKNRFELIENKFNGFEEKLTGNEKRIFTLEKGQDLILGLLKKKGR